MAEPATQHRLNLAEFLAWEPTQTDKHEYWQGEVFAMTGAGQAHVLVAGNCFAALKTYLRGTPCRVYISDMQLAVEQADAAFYPDVFVSCHPEDMRAERVLRHPKIIIEVLSASTAAYDRGEKFNAYRQIPDLQEYILIDPEHRRIDIFRRTEHDEWLLATRDAERGLIIKSIDFSASFDEVFESLPIG